MKHVPEVDTNAEQHSAMLGHLLVARRHDALDLGRACGRADHAGELGEDAVARGVDDAPAVPAHQRQDHGLVALEVANRRGLVLAHETAVASDVCGNNRRKSTLHRGVFVHRPSRMISERCVCGSDHLFAVKPTSVIVLVVVEL